MHISTEQVKQILRQHSSTLYNCGPGLGLIRFRHGKHLSRARHPYGPHFLPLSIRPPA
jgi:hypothetical protein